MGEFYIRKTVSLYEMNLAPEPFALIAAGKKKFELRLNDEKRQLLKVGDKIRFVNRRDPQMRVLCSVKGIFHYPDFAALYRELPLELCGYTEDNIADADPHDMEVYYSAEKIEACGVLGIKIELISEEKTMKTAIITGVLGGIGKASAQLFLEKGYRVFGMDVLDEKFADGLFTGDFTYIRGDLGKREDREELVSLAAESGRIDVLLNVAGVAPKVRADILEMTEESYDRVTGINTRGTFFLTQAVANVMLKQEKEEGIRGCIVNISSCSAYTSSTSRGEYCISKAGVSMITTLFADRLAGEGILVNEICPGIIATGMTATVKEKYDNLIAGGLVPQKRWGYPEDVAKAAMALCDGTLGYTVGQSLIVDGGMHIRRL